MQHHMPPMPPAPKLIDPAALAPFVDPLPIPAIAKQIATRPDPTDPSRKLPYYRVPMHEIESKVHRDVPPSRFWSYGASVPGPTFETRSGKGLLVDWPNELPTRHFLPIDHNLMGAEAGKPDVRAVVHLHGAKAPPMSDGYPENWYTPGRSVVYHYPNQQEAALLWYHDHAMGINRLNIYAGLLGLFIVRDEVEDELNLPRAEYEIPLVLLDRMFRADGQLYYPVSQRPEAPWVPELFGNATLINGKLLPYLDVEPRPYRFRVLNGANARFYRLALSKNSPFLQIGTDLGLLPAPVSLQVIVLAPGERADLIIDFSERKGEELTLLSESHPLMQFRVKRSSVSVRASLPKTLREVPKIPESSAVRTRELTLEEYDNVVDEPVTHLLNGARWHDPITEKPVIDTTEIWSFINVTDDVHPIHLHMVRFQILDRRAFDVAEYLIKKRIRYVGDPFPPEPGEAGWKDTVRATPGAVTRIIVKFEGFTGRYVWHCHILEHEDNEMMRPYEIVAVS
ncbi:MAG: multicopper oxidase domain-containing protein [Acidobacteriaceae bacterium]|nr:multicopper oxidase domain-containing protein [Acidobacteriaceae bacterium]